MARRAGKAANRKARQRSVQRQAQRPATAAQPSAERPAAPATPATPIAPVAAATPAPSRPSSAPTFGVGSSLTTRERAEYHYVERDLRNIGLLTVVMAVLLLVAYVGANALNLV